MMEPSKLVDVYSTNNNNLAEIICGALQAEGIPCQIGGEGQAGLVGFDALEIQLIVRQEDHDRALAFIQDHLENHPEGADDEDDADDNTDLDDTDVE